MNNVQIAINNAKQLRHSTETTAMIIEHSTGEEFHLLTREQLVKLLRGK